MFDIDIFPNGLNEMIVIAGHGLSRELLNQFGLVFGMPKSENFLVGFFVMMLTTPPNAFDPYKVDAEPLMISIRSISAMFILL